MTVALTRMITGFPNLVPKQCPLKVKMRENIVKSCVMCGKFLEVISRRYS